ncbi:MAG: glycoside hydrolase family 2 protein [Kiritimatiellia bacterium]
MKNTFLSLTLASSTLFADNIPAPQEILPRPRLGRGNVTLLLPDGATLRPSDLTARRSLAGTWKFKGLDRQAEPFGPALDSERKSLSPAADDTGWVTIDVPFDWWSDPRFTFDKTYDPQEVYFRGTYRRNFSVPDPADGKRRFLRFEEIGAEAEIYVNGALAGWHVGDFVPCEVEITRFLKPGDNLLGVRVLADLGPAPKEGVKIFTRPYGARWGYVAIKGGIWHEVRLEETPPVRIVDVRIDPAEDFSSIRVRGTIDNAGPGGTFELSTALVEDVPGAPAGKPASRVKLQLANGQAEFDVVVPTTGVKTWSPDDPNLYWAALALTDAAGRPAAAALERFGFRTLRIEGSRFVLNGKPVYLVGDSLHSMNYGGKGTEAAVERLRKDIAKHKANGANTLRTAHMPAIPEVYEFADEIGMMIYDEWCNSFCNRIDEKEFERNNLPALEAFIRRDYNHASVVLWSLGNEVRHHDPEIARQLDKQYDLVKRLDGQKRPACAFSGVADTWAYGADRVKTDFLDTHDYLGIDGDCWTLWFQSMDKHHADMVATFGEDGALTMPLVMWECVGGGWDLRHDDDMKPGDRARYLEWMRKWSHWGSPPGIPFSASAGLLPILDRARGRHYVQSYLATRLCELFRQDRRLAGFAPWFADPGVPGCTRWMQQRYPLLRLRATDDGRFMARHLFSPGEKALECVVVNHTDAPIDGARMEIGLWVDGRETPLGECVFDRIGVFEEGVRPFRLAIPEGFSGDGEIRLRLTSQGAAASLNGYRVRIHPLDDAQAPVANTRPLALAGADAQTEWIFKRLGLSYTVAATAEAWPAGGAVVVPPGAAYDGEPARAFVRDGGTLLLLEPSGTLLAGFPPLYLAPGPNHLVEIVVPSHPAFAGLTQADFDTWAENPYGLPVSQMVCTLDEGVLACRPRYIRGQNQHGMGLCEYGVGKGRLIVSSLNATRLWGENAAATRYVRNVLTYVAGGAAFPDAPPLNDVVSRPAPTDLNPEPVVLVSSEDAPLQLAFPESVPAQKDAPFKILSFKKDLERIAKGKYRYFTITFRSDTPGGMFDVTIPKRDHGNRLTYTIQTDLSRGEAVTMRLDLARDFRFVQKDGFGPGEWRGEIIFYNGYEKEWVPPFPHPPVAAEILEMKFE